MQLILNNKTKHHRREIQDRFYAYEWYSDKISLFIKLVFYLNNKDKVLHSCYEIEQKPKL